MFLFFVRNKVPQEWFHKFQEILTEEETTYERHRHLAANSITEKGNDTLLVEQRN